MILYSVFALGVTFVALFGDNVEKKYKNALMLFAFCILFVFMGVRYGVGQDYFYTYVPVFESILLTGQAQGVEWGFVLINKVVQFFTNDYAFLFLLTSFVFVLFIFLSIRQYDISISMSVFILVCGGFYFYAFNVTRQCITFAMFFLSLKYAKKKSFIPYALINLAGFLIHRTAIIYLPLYFIIGRNVKIRWYIVGIAVCFAFRFFAKDILLLAFKNTKYYYYVTGYYADSTSDTLTVSQLVNIAMFVAYLIFTSKTLDKNLVVFKNIHYYGVLATVFVGVIPLAFRITTMFYFVQFISLPYFYKNCIGKQIKPFILFVIILVYFAIFMNTLLKNGNNIIPYMTIFDR